MTDSPISAPSTRPVSELSYEQARDELVQVVQALESGQTTLEGSLALWERGTALADRCEEWLAGAKARLEAVRGTVEADSEEEDGASQQ